MEYLKIAIFFRRLEIMKHLSYQKVYLSFKGICCINAQLYFLLKVTILTTNTISFNQSQTSVVSKLCITEGSSTPSNKARLLRLSCNCNILNFVFEQLYRHCIQYTIVIIEKEYTEKFADPSTLLVNKKLTNPNDRPPVIPYSILLRKQGICATSLPKRINS